MRKYRYKIVHVITGNDRYYEVYRQHKKQRLFAMWSSWEYLGLTGSVSKSETLIGEDVKSRTAVKPVSHVFEYYDDLGKRIIEW